MIVFQITVDGRRRQPPKPVSEVFKEDILLSPAIEVPIIKLKSERICLFGRFDLANPIHVTYTSGKEDDPAQRKWNVDLVEGTYNVHCTLRAGRPVGITQELSLSTCEPRKEGLDYPRMTLSLRGSKRGSKYDVRYGAEFTSSGPHGWRLTDNELNTPTFKRVLGEMDDLVELAGGSFSLKPKGDWPAGQEQKVGDWLSRHGTTPRRFVADLKAELRHIELPGLRDM